MRQRILRLVLLVLVLALMAVGSSAAPPQPPLDCSQFNQGSCTYRWDQATFCCRPNAGFCVWYCL